MMRKRSKPFWVEGMNAEERIHRVSNLFSALEEKLGTGDMAIDAHATRTFVFVPDPPPLTIEAHTQDLAIRHFSWGVAGRAAATEDVQTATALAPVMFDLWSDSLFVIALEAAAPDDTTLRQWTEHILRTTRDTEHNDEMLQSGVPNYSLICFDWGDQDGGILTSD